MNRQQKGKVSKNPKTPPEILEQLATDALPWIRYRVAQNPSTPIKTLEILATDENSYVRHNVLLNPNKNQIVFMTDYTQFKTSYYPAPVDE
jgi:hypothetical protein